MTPTRRLASPGIRITIVLIVTVLLAGSAAWRWWPSQSAASPIAHQSSSSSSRPATTSTRPDGSQTTTTLPVPAAPADEGLDLRDGPVAIPLELQIPSIGVTASMLGVGVTPGNVMDAPMGPTDDLVWDQAFWYRGSAVPGALSTALIAGHVNGSGGRSAVFGNLERLQPGDLIVVRDTRTGLDVRFSVTESEAYTLEEAAEPAVLTKMYGAGPVAGLWPQPSADGLAHLTLVTCTGTFRNGTHDHRLVVSAIRIP